MLRCVHVTAWLVVGIVALGITTSARAQFAPSIPYNPYSYPYQSFSYPTIVNPALPNQARFRLYDQNTMGPVSLDTPPDAFGPGANAVGASLAAGRGDTNIGKAEVEYGNDVQLREQLYDSWTKESDPAKRAEIAKQMQEVNTRLRSVTESRRRGGTPSAGPRRPAAGDTDLDTSGPGIDPAGHLTSTRRTNAAPKITRPTNPNPNRRPGSTQSRPGSRASNRPSGAPTNAARPDATTNRILNSGRPTNPARPTTTRNNANNNSGGSNRASPPNADRRTPEDIMQRSRELDPDQSTTGAFDPGPSRYGSTGTDRSSSIGRSRFGTGQPTGRPATRPQP